MEQLFVFTVTVLVTVSTDLLIGIAAGIALEVVMSLWYVGLWHTLRDVSLGIAPPSLSARFLELFRNPIKQREFEDREYHLYVEGPLVCFNMLHVIRELKRRPAETQRVFLHPTASVPLVDHTTCDSLHYFLEEYNSSDEHPDLVIDGWDHMQPLPRHEASMRIALVAAGDLVPAAQAAD